MFDLPDQSRVPSSNSFRRAPLAAEGTGGRISISVCDLFGRFAVAWMLVETIACTPLVQAERTEGAVAFRPILSEVGEDQALKFGQPSPWMAMAYRDRILILGEEGTADLWSVDLIPPQDGDLLGWELRLQLSPASIANMARATEAVQGHGCAFLLGHRLVLARSLQELKSGYVSLTNLGQREARRAKALLTGQASELSTAITLRPLVDPGLHAADEIVVTGRGGEELCFGPGQSFGLKNAYFSILRDPAGESEDLPVVRFAVKDDLVADFGKWTETYAGSSVGFFFDGELVSGPIEIRGPLPGAAFLLGPDGRWTERDARLFLERLLGS